MSKKTEVVFSARCGAAARDGVNEDNCLVMESVGKQTSKINHFGDGEYISKVFPLERNGSLLVVADGMGGMNAGEVASAIAIETIANVFKSETIGKMDLSDNGIKKFMVNAIRQADMAIKKEALADPDKEGMGTTVVMLWIFEDNAYYAWCGDSRLYRYHDGRLFQLSHDHSYVCEVLKLSEAEAFDHPDNNIITRSLGNPSDVARPDVCGPLQYSQGDLFLLCSDGLCGVVRNAEIEEAMQYAVENNDKLNIGNLNLWDVAENNGWHDNVTTLLCYVAKGQQVKEEVKKSVPEMVRSTSSFGNDSPVKSNNKNKIIAFAVTVLVVALAFVILWFMGNDKDKIKVEPNAKHDAEEVVVENTPENVSDEEDWLEGDEDIRTGKSVPNLPTERPRAGSVMPENNRGVVPEKNTATASAAQKEPAQNNAPSTGTAGSTAGSATSGTQNVTPTGTSTGTSGTQNGSNSGTKGGEVLDQFGNLKKTKN
ncbi:MAG: serine/threonine-protein phosphatase [Bacteroidales bacterium]|nr:serine/threonine-protein phosphatase [Bacteroidales bacterium]